MRAFTYQRASSAAEAAKVVYNNREAKFLAGGTNLIDLMKIEVETPTHLVDVNGLGLDEIAPTEEGGLRIGYARTDGLFEVAAFVRNITDADNVKGGIDFNNNTAFVNDPRVFGISARVNY